MEASPAIDPISDSNPDPSEQQKSLSSATTAAKSAKRKRPGKPRRTVVVTNPNLEEHLVAEADEAAKKVVEVGNVSDIGADGREQKAMEMDEPVVGKVCELGEKGKSVEDSESIFSQEDPLSFKQAGRTVMDLNTSAVDNEHCTAAKEGGEALKEEELSISKKSLRYSKRKSSTISEAPHPRDAKKLKIWLLQQV